MSAGETWLPCPDFERTHAVSNMGRIVRLPKVKGGKPRMLKTGSTRNQESTDYVRVKLIDGDRSKTTYVHILVARAFVSGYQSGFEVNHINGDKTDNRAANLEWVSHSDNQAHARDVLGRFRGARKSIRRLTDEDIRYIRTSSESQRKLAVRYGVSQVTIHNIRTNRVYKDVE